jgi:hypothetical protein
MRIGLIVLLCCLSFGTALMTASCIKKAVPSQAKTPEKIPTVKFIFVNSFGFRNDSTKHGLNDTLLFGVCLDLKYFDKKTNLSHLDGTCFNRNFQENNFPLKDSILYKEYQASVGCKYTYEVELGWKQTGTFATTRNIKYNLNSYPGADTLKFARDTVIKFIWPDDTASGRFKKTYQWP